MPRESSSAQPKKERRRIQNYIVDKSTEKKHKRNLMSSAALNTLPAKMTGTVSTPALIQTNLNLASTKSSNKLYLIEQSSNQRL